MLTKADQSEELTPVFVTPVEFTALIPEPPPPSVEDLVAYRFADAPVMVRVARAESHFIPTAKNPGSTATGIFQILIGTWRAYHCTGTRTNAADNISCARKIYDAEGTAPWNASRSKWQ